MRKELPHFITDPANQAKVEALLEEGNVKAEEALGGETTRQIA